MYIKVKHMLKLSIKTKKKEKKNRQYLLLELGNILVFICFIEYTRHASILYEYFSAFVPHFPPEKIEFMRSFLLVNVYSINTIIYIYIYSSRGLMSLTQKTIETALNDKSE